MRVQKFRVYLMRKGDRRYEDVGDRVVSISDDRRDAWLDVDGTELHASVKGQVRRLRGRALCATSIWTSSSRNVLRIAEFCCCRLPRDHSVRLANGAAFIAGSFQGFIGDFRPQLLQLPRCRLARVSFGLIRSPRHLTSLPSVMVRGRRRAKRSDAAGPRPSFAPFKSLKPPFGVRYQALYGTNSAIICDELD
jgi:hypothetical protein